MLALLVLLCMCSLSDSTPLSGCKILDLTHTLNSDNPYYRPIFTPFKFNASRGYAGPYGEAVEFLSYKYYETYEHLGTHMDAPYHFSKNGLKMDQVLLNDLAGEACMIDISAKVRSNRTYQLSVSDVLEWEQRHGLVTSDCIVLLHTGQDQFWNDESKFFGSDTPENASTHRYASFSGEVAEFLTAKRKVRAVGVDCISLDGSNVPTFPAHITFLHKAGISGFENMANLGQLPPRGATVFIAPMKIGGGTGGQIRAFALGWTGPWDPCNQIRMSKAAAPLYRSATVFSILLTFVIAV